jgi:hypothetical protein
MDEGEAGVTVRRLVLLAEDLEYVMIRLESVRQALEAQYAKTRALPESVEAPPPAGPERPASSAAPPLGAQSLLGASVPGLPLVVAPDLP